jgi:chromate transporter
LIGYIGGRVAPEKFRTGGHGGDGHKGYGPALIDDDTPPPAHARFKWSRVLAYAAVGLALWAGVEGALVALFGWEGVLTQIGWFFTKAALLTFGGAYAVLPYVYKGAVEHYQWLSATQMIDGLALGETTPGPLIMIVAFVGFVGGWTKVVFGAGSVALAGIAGATVATFFTFLPSFVFILVGAPAVERTRHDIKFTAPLVGITAAVVGVILNLAVFFGYHVLWPNGFAQPLTASTLFAGFEWIAAAIGIVAFVALWRFKVGIIPVVLACGVAGLAYTLIR